MRKKHLIIILLSVIAALVLFSYYSEVRIAYLKIFGKTGDIIHYNNQGLIDGECFAYIDGKLITKSHWKNGLRHGDFFTYYKSGRLEDRSTYKEDKRDGYECHYYENGKTDYVLMWRKNKEFGNEHHWLNDGSLANYDSFDIDNLFCYTQYSKTGYIQQVLGNVISPNIYSVNQNNSTLLLKKDSTYTDIKDLYINFATPPKLSTVIKVTINGRVLNSLDTNQNTITILNAFSKNGKTSIIVEGKLIDKKNRTIKADTVRSIIIKQ